MITLLVTGIGYVLVDMKLTPVQGTLPARAFRGMLHYAFLFIVGARLSHAVGRMTPWVSVAIVLAWLAPEQWLPTLPLKPLVSLPTGPETNA